MTFWVWNEIIYFFLILRFFCIITTMVELFFNNWDITMSAPELHVIV